MTAVATKRDTETVTYLGYRIVVDDRNTRIVAPDGRLVALGRIGFASARAFVRRDRLDERIAQITKEAQET